MWAGRWASGYVNGWTGMWASSLYYASNSNSEYND